MNIGFFYGQRTYPPGMGGSVHGYQLARGLAERGHRLMSWYYGSDENPMVTHYRRRQFLRFISRVDVLYIRVGWDTTLARLSRMRWWRLGRLPVVWELNGLPQELIYEGRGPSGPAEVTAELRRSAAGVGLGIGVTDTIADYLRTEVGLPRTRAIANGSDPAIFAPHQNDGDPQPANPAPLSVIWMGGAQGAWHDLDTVMAAATILADRRANVRITIYGRRDKLPAERPANVDCPGPVPYLELGQHLGRADVGLHLFKPLPDGTLTDGSPLKFFDYMACGLAVVARNAGQTGQVITKWRSGLFFDGAAEDLAARIMTLEQDRPQCRDLGRNGRRAVVEYYNWQRVAQETEQSLLELVNG